MLMCITIFIIISSRCDVIDALTGVMLGDGADTMSAVILDVAMLSDMEIVVMTTPEITLGFVVGVANAVGVLADLPDVIIIDVVSTIDMFPDENVDGLAAVMTPVEFTWPAP